MERKGLSEKGESLNIGFTLFYVYQFLVLQVAVDAGVEVPVSPIIPPLKAKAKAHGNKKTVPPKAVTRNTRGPVYFKCVRVDYDKESGRLNLPKGEFLGKTVHRDVGDEEDKEYSETTLAFEDEGDGLAGTTYMHPLILLTPSAICLFCGRLD